MWSSSFKEKKQSTKATGIRERGTSDCSFLKSEYTLFLHSVSFHSHTLSYNEEKQDFRVLRNVKCEKFIYILACYHQMVGKGAGSRDRWCLRFSQSRVLQKKTNY